MPSNILRYAELVEEPSYAPVTAPTQGNNAAIYLDPSSLSLDLPNETDSKVESAFGRSAGEKYAGFYNPSGDIAYQMNIRSVAYLLKWALGGYAFTGGTGGAFEVQTLTVTAADADGGTYTVRLRDRFNALKSYNFVAAGAATAAAIATQIAGGTFPGWTATAAANVVTFTRTIKAANSTLVSLVGGTSGVSGTGARTTSGTESTPNKHEAYGSDSRELYSFLSRLGKDNFEHCFKGCVVDSLSLEVEDATTSLTASVSSSVDFSDNPQSSSTVFDRLPLEKVIPFHSVNVTIDGVLQERKVKSLSLEVANNVDAEAGRYLGSRYSGRIPAGEREVTLSMELDFSDKAQIERIWGSATGPDNEGSVEFPVEIVLNGGLTPGGQAQALTIKLPRAYYSTVETQPEGRDETPQSVECQTLRDSVLLADGTTSVVTDIYTITTNLADVVQAAA